MRFKGDKPIYLQIVDLIYHKIIAGEYIEDERIPSVRELAVSLEVNPNTVVRSYEYMEDHGVIHKKRGLGYSVAVGSREIVLDQLRTEFLETTLPELVEKVRALKLTREEILKHIDLCDSKENIR